VIDIGGRVIGAGEPALLVAELGLNHGGSIDAALQMVRAAATSGADAVKVQAFSAESFCTEAATYKGERQIDMFQRYELSAVGLSAIAEECKRLGVLFFGTPDSVEQARILVMLGASCLKVGSDDIIHIPLLEQLAAFGLPMILSTGMADAEEIAAALVAVASVPTILLHCVSQYPTPPASANLLRMITLHGPRRLIGYSDHTDGIDAAVGAVWLGACLIEKHFTLNRAVDGPDHAFSADPPQWAEMALRIRLAEAMRGTGGLGPDVASAEMRVTARRSIVAAHVLAAGDLITQAALAFKRPGDGFPPARWEDLVGRHTRRALAKDEQIRLEDCE
jgi:sialic acid synthase SpsE